MCSSRDRGSCSSKKAWRRSFGSSPLTTKEDVLQQHQQQQQQQGSAGGQCDWPALQDDYTYLMSCDLIESCRSVNTEMSWDNGDLQHLKLNLTTVTTPTHHVDCQTDVEITTTPGWLPMLLLDVNSQLIQVDIPIHQQLH